MRFPDQTEKRIFNSDLLKNLLGATGFEPATSRPPAERATKLRHTPQQIYFTKESFICKGENSSCAAFWTFALNSNVYSAGNSFSG